MKMTINPPTGAGYFWWTNLGEHTPTILKVERCSDGTLYADNGEYSFPVGPDPDVVTEAWDEDEESIVVDGVDYFCGTNFWAGPIELPELNGEPVLPDSF